MDAAVYELDFEETEFGWTEKRAECPSEATVLGLWWRSRPEVWAVQ